jgi:hypothetical protein
MFFENTVGTLILEADWTDSGCPFASKWVAARLAVWYFKMKDLQI